MASEDGAEDPRILLSEAISTIAKLTVLHGEVSRAAVSVGHPREVGDIDVAVRGMADEIRRLRRVVAEAVPREVIYCPSCDRAHIEGPRHDDETIDGSVRPHHTHRCYHCAYVWDNGRWSFGVDPSTIVAVTYGRAVELILAGASMTRQRWTDAKTGKVLKWVSLTHKGARFGAHKSLGSFIELHVRGAAHNEVWTASTDDTLANDWRAVPRRPVHEEIEDDRGES